ncbi:MAG: helix-turn-helix domain-containing protein [Thermodesulfobacteriota bacterium]
MGKLEATIKSEIVRLAKREMRKTLVPLGRDVRLLKSAVSQLRKTVLALERFVAQQQNELKKRKIPLEATPEEVKKSRFSPALIRSLRKNLGISQKELAILTGVTVGAAHQWEIGKFNPKAEKKAALVALRKLGRGEVKKLLQGRTSGTAKAKK